MLETFIAPCTAVCDNFFQKMCGESIKKQKEAET